MSRDHIELDTAPFGEECAQNIDAGYSTIARLEARELARMLREQFPNEAQHVILSTHIVNGGEYIELLIRYDADDIASVEAAFHLEDNVPEFWDDRAKAAIRDLKRKLG